MNGDKISKLEQKPTFAGLSSRVEEEIELAYWNYDDRKSKDKGLSDRDHFKWAVREMFKRLRQY